MQFIRFEAELRGQLDRLNAEWQRSREKEPGVVLTLDSEIWGPPEGMMLSRSYPSDFVAFLKKMRFPFRD
jgi:hypothetical protein